jgi:hypothetical protein
MIALFKPTFLKIILAFVLLVGSSVLGRTYIISTISDTFPWGFPLQFYTAWGPCPPGEICNETNIFFFLLDVLFWYLLSGFLVSRIATAKT